MTIRLVPALAAAVVLASAPAVAAQASTPTPTEETVNEAPAAEDSAPEPEPEPEPTEDPVPEPAPEEETDPSGEAPEEGDTDAPTETEAPEDVEVSVAPDDRIIQEGEGTTLTVNVSGVKESGDVVVTSEDGTDVGTATVAGDEIVRFELEPADLEAGTHTYTAVVTTLDGASASAETDLTVNALNTTPPATETPTETPTQTETPSGDDASEEPGESSEAAAEAPELTVFNKTIELRDFVRTEGEEDDGAKYGVTGLTPGETYDIELTTPDGETIDLDSFTADESGIYEGVVFWDGFKEEETEGDYILGTYSLALFQEDGESPAGGDFEVVPNGDDDSGDDGSDDDAEGGGNSDDEPDVNASVSVSPDRLTSTDFVDRSKAVTITGRDFTPGESVTVTITPRGTGVEPYSITRTVGEDGTVVFSVYGTNTSNPEVYVGTYDVYVTEDDSEHGFADTFVVTSNGQSGGGGSYLPRTGGADAAGLAIGGALLALGIGAITVTRRKPKEIGEA